MVKVQVEIFWGKKFNGSYNAETTGEGCYVTVMEARFNNSFRGCPCGSGTTVESAIRDFVYRAAHEYTGAGKLVRSMIEVESTRDYRKPV